MAISICTWNASRCYVLSACRSADQGQGCSRESNRRCSNQLGTRGQLATSHRDAVPSSSAQHRGRGGEPYSIHVSTVGQKEVRHSRSRGLRGAEGEGGGRLIDWRALLGGMRGCSSGAGGHRMFQSLVWSDQIRSVASRSSGQDKSDRPTHHRLTAPEPISAPLHPSVS